MKYSNLLDTKIITERQGAKMPRLVYYANEDEILNKQTFLDWDILSASSTRSLFDYAIAQKMAAFIEQQLGTSTEKTISQAIITNELTQIKSNVSTVTTSLSNEIVRATAVENQIRQEIDDVSEKLSSKIVLIEQEDYDALPSYEQDTIYLIYTPKEYILVEKPINGTFTYDGTSHALASTEAYTVTGSGGYEVGTYHFNVTLNYNPITNTAYKWADGTTDAIIVTYIIEPVIVNTTWHFGDQFPIRFSDDSTWHFGDKFPIVFS